MFLLSAQNHVYIIYIEFNVYIIYIEFRKVCAKKLKSELCAFTWFPGLQNMDVFLENFLWSYFRNHFQVEIVPWSLLVFDFLTVFHMVWESQESWEIWLDGFWGKNAKKFLLTFFFFFSFLSCHYGFANYFEILIFVFSNNITRGVSTCKILLF